MSRFPRTARDAATKCIPYNAPTTQTIKGVYVCVTCGRKLLTTEGD